MTERRRPALRKFLSEQGMKLMQDPRVGKLIQDERVMKAAMQAFQLRGKVQEELDTRVESVAKSLGLVTKSEVRDLKRTVRRLETELKKTQASAEKAAKASSDLAGPGRASSDKASSDKASSDKAGSSRDSSDKASSDKASDDSAKRPSTRKGG